MNKSFRQKKEAHIPQWRVIDAQDKILGRMATEIADILRGKNKPYYTPHTDCGDYVVVINADKVRMTGNKWQDKEYVTYSGWMSGKKVQSARDVLKKHPTKIVELAVRRMLPKNTLNAHIYRKLKVYAGSEHPHKAQVQI